MNTWPLRLFAVFWWLLVVFSAAVACFGVWLIVESHRPNTGYPNADYAGSFYLAFSLLLFAAMTVIRWIITARWRFGPRW